MAKPINDQILDAFRDSGITRYRLAKATGLSTTTVLRWADGDDGISVKNLQKIADYIGMELGVVTAEVTAEKPS